jgi:hypothetical protein
MATEDTKYYGVFDDTGKAQAFYTSDIFPPEAEARNAKIPNGAVEISREQWQILYEDQATARYVDGAITHIVLPTYEKPRSPVELLSEKLDHALAEIEKLKRK